MHPTGKYTATVIKAEVALSKVKQTPAIYYTFRTSEGEVRGEQYFSDKEFTKRDREDKSYVTTMTQEICALIRAVSGRNADFATINEQIAGREMRITVVHEPDQNGKDWPRVKYIDPITGSKSQSIPAPEDMLARLTRQANGGRPPAPVKRLIRYPCLAPVKADDGDVPF